MPFYRVILAVVVAGLASGSSALRSPPTLNDFDYNGVTTYCYWITQGMDVSSFDYSYVKLEAKGTECPLLLTIAQASKDTVYYAGSDVPYQVIATLNFGDNAFGMTALEAAVPDPMTKRPVQVAHANVHACSRATVCDVFRDGANRRISDQETSNFTDDKALFNQKVNFAAAGEYNVFAHVILPPKNARNETYQFVAFTTTTISPPHVSTESGGGSGGVVIALIVVGVVVLLAVVAGVMLHRHRRRSAAPTGSDEVYPEGGPSPSNAAKSSVPYAVVVSAVP